MKVLFLFFIYLTLGFSLRAEDSKPETKPETKQEIKLIEGLKLESIAVDSKIILPKSSFSQALIVDALSAIIVTENKLRFYSFAAKDFLDSRPLVLPADCTHLALISDIGSARRTLYCFGDGKKNDSIRLYKRGKFETLIKTPNKISAVTGDLNRIFFVSNDGLFQVRAQEGIKAVFVSSFLNGVNSMVLDSRHDMIFLATKNQIFSLRGGVLDVLAEGLGGQVALLGEDLLVIEKDNSIHLIKGTKELLTREKKAE